MSFDLDRFKAAVEFGRTSPNPAIHDCSEMMGAAAEEIERLRAEVKELKEADGLPTQAALYVHAIKTISALRAIVDKLPKTADGVPVVPSMRIWAKPGHSTIARFVDDSDGTYATFAFRGWYSTREAAVAARE